MATKRISPQGDNEGGFGRALKRWAEGHFVSIFNTYQTFDDVASAPSSPAAGKTILYAKAGKLYSKISSGVESLVGLSLGTGHTDAAYGDHDHDSDYAPASTVGVPTGGNTNQVLAKNSNTSGDLKWLSISTGGMSFEGFIDCSTDPNYPASTKGCIFVASVAGHIGGASGPLVEQGDQIYCLVDNAGGTHAAVGSSWNIQQANLDSAKLATAYAHSQAAHAPSTAEENVQSDWTQATNTADDYIKNKPTLGTAAAKNFGTADGNLVEIQTGSKLPALDGSLLTNLPSGAPLGETETTAYRGDRGKAAYDHSLLAHAPSNANYYVHPNHSGDVTSVADGAQTIAVNAVTFAKMQKIAALTVMGNDHPTDSLEPQALTKNEMLALLNVADGAQPCSAITKGEIEAKLIGEISSHSHAGGGGGGTTAKVSSNDTTAGYLNGKLVAGNGVVLTEIDNGGNETLVISAPGGGGSVNIVRGAEGQVYAGQVLMYHRIMQSCILSEVVASLATQPAGANVWVDIRKNGTAVADSVLTTAISITTGQSAVNGLYSSPGTLDSGDVDCVAGDVLYIIVTQIGSSFSGSDLLVQIRTI